MRRNACWRGCPVITRGNGADHAASPDSNFLIAQSGYDALRKTHVSVLGDGQAARLDYGAMLGRNAESAHRLAADNIHIDFLIYFLSHDWRLNAISTKGGKP